MNTAAAQTALARAQALDWRWLQATDLEAVEALHHQSIAGMSAQLVKHESRDFLASVLHGRGQMIGALSDGQLVAYGVLLHQLLPSDDPRPLLHLAPQQPLAKLAGASVAPSWRGQHLQRQLILRRMERAGRGAVLFVTAAPGNYASWRNLLACGFSVRALEVCYNGLTRYLLACDPARPSTHTPRALHSTSADFVDIDSLDLERQQTCINAGWHGVAPGSAPGSLRWVPPLTATATATAGVRA